MLCPLWGRDGRLHGLAELDREGLMEEEDDDDDDGHFALFD